MRFYFILMIICPEGEGQLLLGRKVSIDSAVVKIVGLIAQLVVF